ncbi:putative peptidyl-tRNA hydrolase PTRHD1 isoform X3 [Cotesia glomerata]|uniref:putative peptidyl-tRNA hydrolase PTRHD1 isoform X3 n=1 Tax=Cotesia glomerata TaxID=32391 RepID=UPI001D023D96|nr:putative peptidyl-tRNA hydrolase PTRHD1 isoform X3 [Cotesia glomerata]
MLLVYLVFIIANICSIKSHDWGYTDENGPNNWPGLCKNGKRQSPINIETDNTLKDDLGSLKFLHYDYAFTGILTNTGHNASEVPLIVQYVVIRGDLLKTMGWPVGAVIAQACHASTAVTHMFYNDPHTQKYLADLDNMHKIVLEATDESKLTDLHSKLSEAEIDHKLWIEQPENIPTCLVCKPYPKSEISKFFKKFKLFK